MSVPPGYVHCWKLKAGLTGLLHCGPGWELTISLACSACVLDNMPGGREAVEEELVCMTGNDGNAADAVSERLCAAVSIEALC